MSTPAAIIRLDGHLIVHPEHVAGLLELLDLLGEVLRHGGDDLRGDIADRYNLSLHGYLVDAVDIHAHLLRHATTTTVTKDRHRDD